MKYLNWNSTRVEFLIFSLLCIILRISMLEWKQRTTIFTLSLAFTGKSYLDRVQFPLGCWKAIGLKMISSPFCAVSVLNVCEPHTKECELMLFIKKYAPYPQHLSNSFSNSFNDFYSCEVVSWSNMRKNKVSSFDRFASIVAVVLKLSIYFV